jgi:hypothetical protein
VQEIRRPLCQFKIKLPALIPLCSIFILHSHKLWCAVTAPAFDLDLINFMNFQQLGRGLTGGNRRLTSPVFL